MASAGEEPSKSIVWGFAASLDSPSVRSSRLLLSLLSILLLNTSPTAIAAAARSWARFSPFSLRSSASQSRLLRPTACMRCRTCTLSPRARFRIASGEKASLSSSLPASSLSARDVASSDASSRVASVDVAAAVWLDASATEWSAMIIMRARRLHVPGFYLYLYNTCHEFFM